jgi:hypothetical protein
MEKNVYSVIFIDNMNTEKIYTKEIHVEHGDTVEEPNNIEYDKNRHDTKEFDYTFTSWLTKDGVKWDINM